MSKVMWVAHWRFEGVIKLTGRYLRNVTMLHEKYNQLVENMLNRTDVVWCGLVCNRGINLKPYNAVHWLYPHWRWIVVISPPAKLC